MISGLNHVTLAVSDLERSFDFYSRLLGFAPVARWAKGAYLEAGDLWLALILDPELPGIDRRDYSHIAFGCSAQDFPRLSEGLKREGYVSWSENRSEGDSYYFRDPDGHKLEIHVGDLASRLKDMKDNPWGEIEFFR